MDTNRSLLRHVLSLALACALGGALDAGQGFFSDGGSALHPQASSPYRELHPTVTGDGLTLFFESNRPEGQGEDIYMVTREATHDEAGNPLPFGPVVTRLGAPVNGPSDDGHPSISGDGLELFFVSRRDRGGEDIYVARRRRTHDDQGRPAPFEEVIKLGPAVNSLYDDSRPEISADGRRLYFDSPRPGGSGLVDLYRVTRPEARDEEGGWVPFEGEAENLLPPVNSEFRDGAPSISDDGLTLIWSDILGGVQGPWRQPGHGLADLWMATRETIDGPFSVRNLGPPVSTPGWECCPEISSEWPASGAVVYYVRFAGFEDSEILVATWHPDCNGNLVDDAQDIADGVASDCDRNGVPDSCDILRGSGDSDRDGIPDACQTTEFQRGDANDDGAVQLADAVFILSFLFLVGAEPQCLEAANVNDDERNDVSDPVWLLSHLFLGGPPPPVPFVDCGRDPGDSLGCEAFRSCFE